MAELNARMEDFARRQLELGRDVWWITDELVRKAKVEQSAAREFVEGLASEVHRRIARRYLVNLWIGIFLILVSVGVFVAMLSRGIIAILWMVWLSGIAIGSYGYFGWRRYRRVPQDSK